MDVDRKTAVLLVAVAVAAALVLFVMPALFGSDFFGDLQSKSGIRDMISGFTDIKPLSGVRTNPFRTW